MKIIDIRTKPLLMRLNQPYVWAQGVRQSAPIILIEIEADDGTIGYGEAIAVPNAEAVEIELHHASRNFIGASPFDVSALCSRAYQAMFKAFGANIPRHGALIFAGLEMALWDLMGKATDSNNVWSLVGAIFTLLVAFAWRFQPAAAPQLKFREEVGFERAVKGFWKMFSMFFASAGFYTFTEVIG